MKLCKVIVMACFLLSWLGAMAQENSANYRADTAQVNKLLKESKNFILSEPDKAIDLNRQAMRIASNAGFRLGEANALKNIGVVNYYRTKYGEASAFYDSALVIFKELNDNVGIASVLSNKGVISYDQGNDTKALDLYLQSLHYAEMARDKLRMLTVLNNMGGIYYIKVESLDSATASNQSVFDLNLGKALETYFKAEPIAKELGDDKSLGTVLVNIGSLYYHNKEDEKALAYFDRALKAFGIDEQSYSVYNAKAKLYLRKGNFALAKENSEKALTVVKKTDNKLFLAQTQFGLAEVHKKISLNDPLQKKDRLKQAIFYYKEAEKNALEIDAKNVLRDVYREMAQADSTLGNYQSAFVYYKKYTEKAIEVFNDESEKTRQKMQYGFDINKKETEISLLTKDKAIKDAQIVIQDAQIEKQKAFKNALIVGLSLVLIIIIVLFRDYRLKIRTNRLLDKQKMQIENLLLNILPQEVAHELQSTGRSTPRNYESVTVLFTDFKSFTAHAEKMSPDEVVKELNTCFMAFDEIIERHNLEKIKTIGDAYMCAGGIPTPSDGHVFRMVKASLEIQDFIYRNNQRRKEENLPPWEIRIGINVGPVVAGVVGKKKYAYDIWGSAVNIASRMESNGMPGQINISSSVYEVIKDQYACIYRGKIYAKNVGEIDMYFIDHEIESFDDTFKTFEEVEKKEPVRPAEPTTDLLQ